MNRKDFHARRGTPSDLEKLVSFAIAEAEEAEKTARPSGPIREGVRVGLTDDSIAMYWVLEDGGGEIVGNLSVVKEWSNWNAGYYWWIQSMFLLPGYRGKGLTGKLLEAVKEVARQEGAVDLRLYVHIGNERAIKAYRKSGFSDLDYRIMTMPI
jgi:GNAT superfamily N-acetyltransferase